MRDEKISLSPPHGYPDYYDQWGRKLHPHEVILNYTQEKEQKIMAALDAVTAAVKAAEARLDSFAATVTGLKITAANLQSEIDTLKAAGQAVDPALQALADELNAHVESFDAALNPPTV
jgi:ABC-type transporter Mla subunit MlaD